MKSDANRRMAWRTLNLALKAGTMHREPCRYEANQTCSVGVVEAHHHKGYAKEHWLNVVWLCKRHHEMLHAMEDNRRRWKWTACAIA